MVELWRLFKGELKRFWRYKILFFSVLVTLIWVVILYFAKGEETKGIFPALLLMDAGLMSIILLGSGFFLEKQERTLSTLMVTPVSPEQILASKIATSMLMSVISYVFLTAVILIFHDFDIQLLPLFIYTLIVASAHLAIGYVITLYSKDFMQMLVRYMGVILLFMVPVLLAAVDVTNEWLDVVYLLSPSYAGLYLFESAIVDHTFWRILLALVYLLVISGSLYPTIIIRRFKAVSVR